MCGGSMLMKVQRMAAVELKRTMEIKEDLRLAISFALFWLSQFFQSSCVCVYVCTMYVYVAVYKNRASSMTMPSESMFACGLRASATAPATSSTLRGNENLHTFCSTHVIHAISQLAAFEPYLHNIGWGSMQSCCPCMQTVEEQEERKR